MVSHQPLVTRESILLHPVFEARVGKHAVERNVSGKEREIGKTSRQIGVPLLLSGKKLAQVFADAC